LEDKRRKRESKRSNKETALHQHKQMQLTFTEQGPTLIPTRRRKNVDPSVPSYVRLPPNPMPTSWVKRIVPLSTSSSPSIHRVDSILNVNLNALLGNGPLKCVLMDPPLDKISVKQWAKLRLLDILPFGFLFLWVEKEFIRQVLQEAEAQWGFRYVENFVWVKQNSNNTIAKQPSQYFAKSKLTCLILRKDDKNGKIDLRHQRNPDVQFDFVNPLGKVSIMNH
jgi:hypothetical protein